MSENNEREFYTLTDEEGNEIEFELIGVAEKNGTTYYAMIPVEDAENGDNDEGFCEYVVLRAEKDENGEDITIMALKVIKLLQSLCSRGYVSKTYSWYAFDCRTYG